VLENITNGRGKSKGKKQVLFWHVMTMNNKRTGRQNGAAPALAATKRLW
jgi:hypothetical protein